MSQMNEEIPYTKVSCNFEENLSTYNFVQFIHFGSLCISLYTLLKIPNEKKQEIQPTKTESSDFYSC